MIMDYDIVSYFTEYIPCFSPVGIFLLLFKTTLMILKGAATSVWKGTPHVALQFNGTKQYISGSCSL